MERRRSAYSEELAETLKRIRDNGREGFYSGKTARLIIKEMKRGNGIISEQDLNDYKSVSRIPLTADYRGYKIIYCSSSIRRRNNSYPAA